MNKYLLCVLWAVERDAFVFWAGFFSCSGTWLVDGTVEDVDWPKRARRNRLAILFAWCVTSTRKKISFAILRFLTLKHLKKENQIATRSGGVSSGTAFVRDIIGCKAVCMPPRLSVLFFCFADTPVRETPRKRSRSLGRRAKTRKRTTAESVFVLFQNYLTVCPQKDRKNRKTHRCIFYSDEYP